MAKTKTKRDYESIRSQLNTGDIVLFSGKGGASAGIKWATASRWSHVAMVFNLAEYDFVTLWETTTLSSIEDLDTREMRKGVQLIPLSDRVQTYDGEIAVRRLNGITLGEPEIEALMDLRKEFRGRPYETSEIELIKAAYEGPFGLNEEDFSSLFCSELVAESFKRMQLLPDSQYPRTNTYPPISRPAERSSFWGFTRSRDHPPSVISSSRARITPRRPAERSPASSRYRSGPNEPPRA